MLRSLSKHADTLFAKAKGDKIVIVIDEITDDKYKSFTERVIGFHDKHNQCMHTIIKSFSISESDQLGFKRNPLQATFHFKPSDDFDVHIVNKTKVPLQDIDKAYLLTKCAAESIMKLLFAEKLVENELISFQGRRGSSITASFDIFSTKLKMVENPSGQACATNDLIATVEAQLIEHQIVMYFNKVSDEEIARATEIFAKHFKQEENLQVYTL